MGVAGQGKGSVLVSEQQAGRHPLGVLDAGVSFRGTEAALHHLGASAPGAVSGGGRLRRALCSSAISQSGEMWSTSSSASWLLDGRCDKKK